MLKAVGILCILAGSTGLGMSMARELELRIEELLQLQKLMLRLRGEIRYMHRTLPEAFFNLAGSASPPFSVFFPSDIFGTSGSKRTDCGRDLDAESSETFFGPAYYQTGTDRTGKTGEHAGLPGCADQRNLSAA